MPEHAFHPDLRAARFLPARRSARTPRGRSDR